MPAKTESQAQANQSQAKLNTQAKISSIEFIDIAGNGTLPARGVFSFSQISGRKEVKKCLRKLENQQGKS